MNAKRPCDTHYPQVEQHRSAILKTLDRVGTPLFLCERENLVDRYRALDDSLAKHWPQHVIGYSFKTNYQVARSGILEDCGAWAEVVSGREYQLAQDLGYPGSSIIFNGPYKTDDDLRAATAAGSLVNVNDRDELDRICQFSAAASAPLEIGLRLSGTLPALGHSRFGFSMENGEATDALEEILRSPRVKLVGLHTHLYGDTDQADIYAEAARQLGEFARASIPNYQESLNFIDMGGGFPAHSPQPKSRRTWNPQPIDVYVRTITETLRPFFDSASPWPTLVVEPGRYLTCDGILLVTRVIHVKRRDGKQIVNGDGSISMVALTHYCPQIIRAYTSDLVERNDRETDTTIHGATCRENDILYEGTFPECQPGDYLIHFAAGAYNASLSSDFIFKSPPMEVF